MLRRGFFLSLVLVSLWSLPGSVLAVGEPQTQPGNAQVTITDNLSAGVATTEYLTPALNVPIPGLEFQPIRGDKSSVSIAFLGDYVSNLYRFLIGLGIVVAIVMMMVGGLQYAAGGNHHLVQSGKKRIEGAIIGLVLLLLCFVILYSVNPRLTIFEPINLDVIEPVEFEVVLHPEAGANSRLPGHDSSLISGLIGEPPNTLAKCSPELALDAATKLHQLNICVGPCHCAFTASHFLQYIGCSDVYNGNAHTLPVLLEQRGWIAERVPPKGARQHMGVGLLVTKGHVGISVGGGKYFESGSGSAFANLQKRANVSSCPVSFVDALGNPQACGVCAKIPEHAPSTGRYGAPSKGGIGGGQTCEKNQGWTLADNFSSFSVLVRPPKPGESRAPTGCCVVGQNTYAMSEIVCTIFTEKDASAVWTRNACGS